MCGGPGGSPPGNYGGAYALQWHIQSPLLAEAESNYQNQIDCAFNRGSCPNGVPSTPPVPPGMKWVSGGCTSYSYSTQLGGDSGWLGCENGAFISFKQWVDNWQQYPQEYRNGVAYIIAFRSGMSPEDVRIQQLATQITEQVNQPMTPCEFVVDVPAAASIVAGPWFEGATAYAVYGAGAAGTLVSWSVCK